jgi:ribokinase
LRTAVVGHVEWVEFLRVARLPLAGEIVHASEFWEEAAGGGPGAAAQLLKLSGDCALYTALGNDEVGRASSVRLSKMGLRLHLAIRHDEPTRRAITFVDEIGERTITVIGERLNPWRRDDLPWDELDDVGACYFTAGDPEALAAARRARILVATSRVLPIIKSSGVHLNALVGSADDPSETYRHGDLASVPDLVVLTDGERGGTFSERGGPWRGFEPGPLAGPIVDRYGAGDSFAGALAFGLGAGLEASDAIALAASCGAAVLGGRGPYEAQSAYEDVADLLP